MRDIVRDHFLAPNDEINRRGYMGHVLLYNCNLYHFRENPIFLEGNDHAFEMIRTLSHGYSHSLVTIYDHTSRWDKLDETYEHIHIYRGHSINRLVEYEILTEGQVRIPKYLINPSSWDEVFDNLGDEIVRKPFWGSNARRVEYISKDTRDYYDLLQSDPELGVFVYTEYVGPSEPPFWKARVHILHGHVIGSYVTKADYPIVQLSEDMTAGVHKSFEQVALKAYEAFDRDLKLGIISFDMTMRDGQIYVVDSNLFNVAFDCLMSSDNLTNRADAIATACINKLEKLSMEEDHESGT
jgi:hypothetical protein